MTRNTRRTTVQLITGAILFGTLLSAVGFGQAFGTKVHDRSKPVSVLTFTVNHREIQPAVTTVRPGQYLIRFRNALTTADMNWTFQEVGKSRSARIDQKAGRNKDHRFFDLDPGDYEITVENYPGLKAVITVKP